MYTIDVQSDGTLQFRPLEAGSHGGVLATDMLDSLSGLLADAAARARAFAVVRHDPVVCGLALCPTDEQLLAWVRFAHKGVAYAAATYGTDAIPPRWGVLTADAPASLWTAYRRYPLSYLVDDDAVQVSAAHVAEAAQEIGKGKSFVEPRLPFPVTTGMWVSLQMLEECYHRYQLKVLGMEPADTLTDRDHPLERAIGAVWQQAVDSDFGSYVPPQAVYRVKVARRRDAPCAPHGTDRAARRAWQGQ